MAESITLGIVGIKNMGVYDATTAYEKLNVVTYQGSTYCALRDTIGNLPTDTDYWQLYAEKGGKGDPGEQGPKPVKGVDYYTASDIAEIEEDLSDTIASEVSTVLGDLTTATPLVAASTEDMTDTTRVYVNTTDGHWYWYDGDSWEDGGVYQATAIGENAVGFNELKQEVKNIFNYTIPTESDITLIENSYINSAGTLNSQNSYNIIRFAIPKGYQLHVKAKATSSIAVISSYDSDNNTYTRLVLGSDGNNYTDYYYNAPTDMIVAISYYKTNSTVDYGYYLIEKNIDDKINNFITDFKDYIDLHIPTYTIDTGHYINQNGSYTASGPFRLTSVINVPKGCTLEVKCGASATVSVIARKNSDNTYTSLVVGETHTEQRTYRYFCHQNENLVVSFISTIDCEISYFLTLKGYYPAIEEDIKNSHDDILNMRKNIFSMFKNITTCGDSLTFSQVYTGVSTHRQAYMPWPTQLGAKTGATIKNLAVSGDTATSWWNRYESQLTQADGQLVIIYLGTNFGLTDTIDTDCVGDDYTQYANTNTGNYGKIIAKSLSLGAKVLLVKLYASGGSGGAGLETTNAVIDKFATKFNVAVVKNDYLDNMVYHRFPDNSGHNATHYNDLGYAVFLEKLIENTSNLSDEMLYKLLID